MWNHWHIFGLFWFILVYFGLFWFILVYFGLFKACHIFSRDFMVVQMLFMFVGAVLNQLSAPLVVVAVFNLRLVTPQQTVCENVLWSSWKSYLKMFEDISLCLVLGCLWKCSSVVQGYFLFTCGNLRKSEKSKSAAINESDRSLVSPGCHICRILSTHEVLNLGHLGDTVHVKPMPQCLRSAPITLDVQIYTCIMCIHMYTMQSMYTYMLLKLFLEIYIYFSLHMISWIHMPIARMLWISVRQKSNCVQSLCVSVPVPPTLKWVKIWSKAWNCQYASFWTDTEPMPGTKVKNGKHVFKLLSYSQLWCPKRSLSSCQWPSKSSKASPEQMALHSFVTRLRGQLCCGRASWPSLSQAWAWKRHTACNNSESWKDLKKKPKKYEDAVNTGLRARQTGKIMSTSVPIHRGASKNLRWPWRSLRLASILIDLIGVPY